MLLPSPLWLMLRHSHKSHLLPVLYHHRCVVGCSCRYKKKVQERKHTKQGDITELDTHSTVEW
jgi:hypothetical protein